MPVSTVLHFSQENVIRDLELNEVYGQCKKHPLPSRRKDKEAIDEAGESKKEKWGETLAAACVQGLSVMDSVVERLLLFSKRLLIWTDCISAESLHVMALDGLGECDKMW